jgi:Fe2+ transport system protein FeoA
MPTTLASLRAGAVAVVTGFAADDEAMRKLLALGIVPGDRLRLRATWPAFVFELGATSYALDRELARAVQVVVASDLGPRES